MSSITATSQLEKHQYKKIPLTGYDAGWILLNIGMAIGAGTVVVPVQIGLKGIWVFIAAFLIAYPATYMLQNLYLKTLSESDLCEDYSNIISQYLGKNWGMALGIMYFIMLVHGMFIYSTAIIYDSASYLTTFGVTDSVLSESVLYTIAVLSALIFIASRGEQLLFKISGPMVVVKVSIIVLLGVVMIPHWDFNNIKAFPSMADFSRDVLLTIPFAFFSAVFIQILNPMNIAYRKREEDKEVATFKAIRVHRISFIILISIIIFFSFSFSFSISYEQALEAFNSNISALAMAAKVIPGKLVHIMTVLLNVSAVVTAFFGIYLGFQEAVKGILVNIIQRFIPEDQINHQMLSVGTYLFIVTLLTFWVSLGFSVVIFFHIASPLYGIVSCLIPCYLVYRVNKLHKFQGLQAKCVLLFGLLLVISPFFKFFE
ncbi:amino acid permease [Vibrio panuliri]|uniref:Transporter n=1 Tax=Vibrio panuliri TaxID=1381081 RepID=A0ABX3FMS3_9VIBR|nr:amino acid permease [Vibrio panuliri]KAB1454068.1 transporter [Vibrio panuliri]OLQ95511.1 transporter [Vibrio panuliri]